MGIGSNNQIDYWYQLSCDIKFGKYTYKTIMGRKDKNSHTGRVPSTAAVFPRRIATAAPCIRK